MTTLPGGSRRPDRRRRRSPRAAGHALLDELDFLMEAASRAPSPGNRRPWRFRARDGGLDLLCADHPGGAQGLAGHACDRQDVIACGAALFNLRLATGHLGVEPRVAVLPIPEAPQLLARLEPGGGRAPRADEEDLLGAVGRRRTRRDAFDRSYLPPPLLDHLAAAVAAEGAALLSVPVGPRLAALDEQLSAAEDSSDRDPARPQGLRAP
ncbi:MAG: hypothetical protein ACRDV1_01950, partial [Actinomycetes bacterium]